MKLFTQYSRINVLMTIAIFLIACVSFYAAANYVQLQQVDGNLLIEKEEIILYAKKYNHLPNYISVDDQRIEFREVEVPIQKDLFDIVELQEFDGGEEDFRQLVFGISVNGKSYKVTVSKSLEDTEHLIQTLLVIAFVTILLILLASFVINRFILKRLWKPFYRSLDAVERFKVNKIQQLHFEKSKTEEFQLMNDILERITRQAQLDYLSLKTFSENASHEIQTPLAIIRSKLDLLIQDPQLAEKQSEFVQSIYNAIQKLSKLNESLLLLTKIENKQFGETESIDLKAKLEDKIKDFEELWHSKELQVQKSIAPATLHTNLILTELLLNNLLSNAIKHNKEHGIVSINLEEKCLSISNSSSQGALDTKQVFQKFYKPSALKESNGLGLAIIKQICDVSGLTIDYEYKKSRHYFTVRWR